MKTFDEVRRMCADLYDREPCGGSLHIVLDDGNLDDVDIAYCYGCAKEEEDELAVEICECLLSWSEEMRQQLYESYPYDKPILFSYKGKSNYALDRDELYEVVMLLIKDSIKNNSELWRPL